MKNKLYLTFLLISLSQESFSYPCLFPTNESKEQESEKISLSALLYIDPTHWSLWINNEKFGPESPQNFEDFFIEKVSSSYVKFSWTPENSCHNEYFTLRPNQSFLLNKKEVIDE